MGYLDHQAIAAIEKMFTQRLIEHFRVDVRTLLFDATNFDTYVNSQTHCELAQRGHAKSKRKDLRIIGLSLLVSADFHIPLLSYLYPGNHNDPTMFANVIDDLVDRYKQLATQCQDITLIFDGGNSSRANMEEISESHYAFVTSLTLTHHQDLLQIPLSRFESFSEPRLSGTTAHRKKKVVWGQERTVVITRSDKLLAGQLAGIQAALGKKRKQLWQLWTKLHNSQKPHARGKGYTVQSLQKRLDAITSGQYISEILKTNIVASKNHLDFHFQTDSTAFQRLKRVRLGKRILCTDRHDWSTEQIILASRAQSCIEDAFKDMKNPHWVSFSPSFHWTDQKLRVHFFYCLIALTLSSLLVRKAHQAGNRLSIAALYEQLSDVTEILNFYPSDSKSGRPKAEYVLSQRSPLQNNLCQLFNVYAHSRATP